MFFEYRYNQLLFFGETVAEVAEVDKGLFKNAPMIIN